jgi:CRISPR-associated endonuclease Csn1
MNDLTQSKNFGEWTAKDGHKVFQTQIPLELQKGFTKKRIDHRHHAMDALIIACVNRSHINYLNNQSALGNKKTVEQKQKSRNDLRAILCAKKYNDPIKEHYKWTFIKPWDTFTQDAREKLFTTVVSFKQNLRVINKTINFYEKWIADETGKLRKQKVKQEKGDSWAIRKPMHKDTVSGMVNLQSIKKVKISEAIKNWENIVDRSLRKAVKQLIKDAQTEEKIIKSFKEAKNIFNGQDFSNTEVYYWDTKNVASRVKLDGTFDSARIRSITDRSIQAILSRHLAVYNEEKAGKIVERPDLAFSDDGLDQLNQNIVKLNNGKNHHSIYKVRTYELRGNKFPVGTSGNKKDKYVEAAKGTNLFFGIYVDQNRKRTFSSIPLNIIVERQKQGLQSVPEKNEKGNELLFHISPNDLVYMPAESELENPALVDWKSLKKDQVQRVYKNVSFSGAGCFFIRNDIAAPIVNKLEFSPLNKMEKSIEGATIKGLCWKLEVDRLGRIHRVIK